MSEIQFWDTSALIPLIFEEANTSASLKARERGIHQLAWGWLAIEAQAALYRRKAQPKHFRILQTYLDNFEFIDLSPDSGDYPALVKLLEKHRLRSADAGHLFCLKKAKELFPDIELVCFDEELNGAAKKEGFRVFRAP